MYLFKDNTISFEDKEKMRIFSKNIFFLLPDGLLNKLLSPPKIYGLESVYDQFIISIMKLY